MLWWAWAGQRHDKSSWGDMAPAGSTGGAGLQRSFGSLWVCRTRTSKLKVLEGLYTTNGATASTGSDNR